jgi:hypothetical protein
MNALVSAIAVASIALGALSFLAIVSSELARRSKSKRTHEGAETALEAARDSKSKEPLPFPSSKAPLDVIAADRALTDLARQIVRPH